MPFAWDADCARYDQLLKSRPRINLWKTGVGTWVLHRVGERRQD